MIATCRDGSYAGKIGNLYRCEAVGGCPDAELPIAVVSPGPDGSVGLYGQRMVSSRSNGNHVRKSAHLRRNIAVGYRTDAELPIAVVSPGPDSPVAFQSQRMTISCCNGGSDDGREVLSYVGS